MANALVAQDTHALARQGERQELIQLVTFELNGELYGVEVLSVKEIIRMTGITHMPNAPDFVEGVIDLRGTVIPIVNMRLRFFMPSKEVDSQSRILVMEMKSGKLVGFIVDAVSEVIRVSSSSINPAPDLAQHGGAQDCVIGIMHHHEHLLILLDLNLLFDEFEQQLG